MTLFSEEFIVFVIGFSQNVRDCGYTQSVSLANAMHILELLSIAHVFVYYSTFTTISKQPYLLFISIRINVIIFVL